MKITQGWKAYLWDFCDISTILRNQGRSCLFWAFFLDILPKNAEHLSKLPRWPWKFQMALFDQMKLFGIVKYAPVA